MPITGAAPGLSMSGVGGWGGLCLAQAMHKWAREFQLSLHYAGKLSGGVEEKNFGR